ncbi:MAG: thioredoxin-disulfide reductase [Firmicutes bacterium]|nr:thioredoxin-disulfide reductase [Bacillota bacterium]
MTYDVIIIGSGPAGLTAGIYATRGGKKALIIEGGNRGGAIILTDIIENYSGFKHIDGFTLAENMREQAELFGTEFLSDTVTEYRLDGVKKSVVTELNGEIFAKNIILCMGTESRRLGLANEDKLIGRGVSYCATCDGFFFKNKTVVVNGGGDTALTEAMYLKKICKEVYLVHRRHGFKASAVLAKRLLDSGVKLVLDSVIEKLNGEPLKSITVKNVVSGETKEIETDGLFVAIGTIPRTELLKGKIDLNESGYIITDEDMKTNIAGVFGAGDIRQKSLRQVITACADGAIASFQID